jgi:hypothetical protein
MLLLVLPEHPPALLGTLPTSGVTPMQWCPAACSAAATVPTWNGCFDGPTPSHTGPGRTYICSSSAAAAAAAAAAVLVCAATPPKLTPGVG